MAEAVFKNSSDVGIVTIPAPAALAPGEVIDRVGKIGIYNGKQAAASGELVAISTRGQFDMTATSGDTWSDGAVLYWTTGNVLTTTEGSNILAGSAVGAKVSGTVTARVDINR